MIERLILRATVCLRPQYYITRTVTARVSKRLSNRSAACLRALYCTDLCEINFDRFGGSKRLTGYNVFHEWHAYHSIHLEFKKWHKRKIDS